MQSFPSSQTTKEDPDAKDCSPSNNTNTSLCLKRVLSLYGHERQKSANLAALQIGQPRAIVILNLGQPANTVATTEGRVDLFELEPENAPSAGRALGHATLDLITFGGWELFGTPIEAVSAGDKLVINVEYDKDDKVKSINSGGLIKAAPPELTATAPPTQQTAAQTSSSSTNVSFGEDKQDTIKQ